MLISNHGEEFDHAFVPSVFLSEPEVPLWIGLRKGNNKFRAELIITDPNGKEVTSGQPDVISAPVNCGGAWGGYIYQQGLLLLDAPPGKYRIQVQFVYSGDAANDSTGWYAAADIITGAGSENATRRTYTTSMPLKKVGDIVYLAEVEL